jgi:carboxymethylenebutenolidase
MGDVTITTEHGAMGAHLAVPAGTDAVPGVVVLHEAFGLNDDIRSHADHLAGAGYLAVAPDLYARGGALRCLAATMAALARGQGRAFDDIEATRKWLLDHDRCSGRVGIIGFCMGGGFAIACAPKGGFSAAAPNYGMVPRHAERALAGACPMVGSYGGKDWMMPGQARRLEGALAALGIPHDVKEYPGATHSFLNRHTGAVPSTLDRIARIRFSPQAAENAWARILRFFGQHLGPGGHSGADSGQ